MSRNIDPHFLVCNSCSHPLTLHVSWGCGWRECDCKLQANGEPAKPPAWTLSDEQWAAVDTATIHLHGSAVCRAAVEFAVAQEWVIPAFPICSHGTPEPFCSFSHPEGWS